MPVNDASWALSALLTVAFVIAAFADTGGLAVGWFVLALGMAVVTYVRFNAARTPRDGPDVGDPPNSSE